MEGAVGFCSGLVSPESVQENSTGGTERECGTASDGADWAVALVGCAAEAEDCSGWLGVDEVDGLAALVGCSIN